MRVFLLWHTQRLSADEDNSKRIGVYSTADKAREALGRMCHQPGFHDAPEGFEICSYAVDEDHWAVDFVTVYHG